MLAFYRLMAAWMLRMASPAAAAGGQPQLPLPTPAPDHFRMLPVSICSASFRDLSCKIQAAAPAMFSGPCNCQSCEE